MSNSNAQAAPAAVSAPGAPREGQKILLPGQTSEGEYVLSVLVKRTYDILPGTACVRAESDKKLISGDVHYDDPMNSSVKLESDFVPFKVATDVVLNGTAYAPGGQAVQTLTVSLAVGGVEKTLRITGDRVCRYRDKGDPLFTEPLPFTSMDIRYERAFGGVDIASDPAMPCVYGRNPLGRGFVVKNAQKSVDNLLLPNIEDPADILSPEKLCVGHFMHWERQPMPAGFGWVAKYWQPRASLAGVLPADRQVEQALRQAYSLVIPPEQREMYEKTRLPDMDFRFFNGASSGLALPFLSGDEEIRLVNLTPEGELSFHLPGARPRIGLDIGMGLNEPEVLLHTVMLRMEELQVDLTWRGAVPYPGPDWLPQMRKLEIVIQ